MATLPLATVLQRRAPLPGRLELTPLYLSGVLALLLMLLSTHLPHRLFPGGEVGLAVVELLALAALSVAVVGWVRRGGFGSPGVAAGHNADRAMALKGENERLIEELRVSRERLQASRARIVEAAELERRRVAQDLHDGLQSRLVLLALRANGIEQATASPTVVAEAAELGAGLHEAITELRELVQGMVPAALTEAGLYAATEDLADRVAIPVDLDLDERAARPPAPVESTGYFVIAEALANAVKHARARGLAVRIGQVEKGLRVEVADDGVGGAHLNGGSGLRGMADRVHAIGGWVGIESPPGGGTRVVAELPCA